MKACYNVRKFVQSFSCTKTNLLTDAKLHFNSACHIYITDFIFVVR